MGYTMIRCLSGVFALMSVINLAWPPQQILEPVAPSISDLVALEKAKSLVDGGEPDKAITILGDVLARNPDCPIAIYEQALAHYHLRDYSASLALASKGCTYRNTDQTPFLALAGGALDSMNRSEDSLPYFEAAITAKPTIALYHYNYALALMKLDRQPEAISELELAVLLDPEHSSSHYSLGLLYAQTGRSISSMLAFARFLTIEPASARSRLAIASNITRIKHLASIAIIDNKTKKITLTPRNICESYVGFSFSVTMSGAFFYRVVDSQSADYDALHIVWSVALEALTMEKELETAAFSVQYYLPYFSQIAINNYSDAFYCYTHQSISPENNVECSKCMPGAGSLTDYLRFTRDFEWLTYEQYTGRK